MDIVLEEVPSENPRQSTLTSLHDGGSPSESQTIKLATRLKFMPDINFN
jgi:hypothetical protein